MKEYEFYLQKGNKKDGPYTSEDLSNHDILLTPDTKIWSHELSKWSTADHFDELEYLIEWPKQPIIQNSNPRKSIYNTYWYDRSNSDHFSNLKGFIEINSILYFLAFISDSISNDLDILLFPPWNISIYTLFPVLLTIYVVSRILIYKLHPHFYNRYYRVIKRKKERGDKEASTAYVLQTCVSRVRTEKTLNENRVKWKDTDVYSSDSYGNIKDVVPFFDRKTIEKTLDEILFTSIKKSIHKPKFMDKFRERNNILKKEMRLLKSPGFFIFFPTLIAVFIETLPFLRNYPSSSLHTILYGLGIFLLIAMVVFIYNRINSHRFLRVIERTIQQGRYKKRTYHVQSFISNKNIEKIRQKKDIKWTDYIPYDGEKDIHRTGVMYDFHKRTTELKITDEIL